MSLVFLICGITLGLISLVLTLLLGFGILFALLAYVLGGIAGMGLSLAVVVLRRHSSDGLVATES